LEARIGEQKFLSQPFHVAEAFAGLAGQYVSTRESVVGFDRILKGELDHVPDNDFYMKGSIASVLATSQPKN
jgi:F-type H+-transporting ATPase subunit beta